MSRGLALLIRPLIQPNLLKPSICLFRQCHGQHLAPINYTLLMAVLGFCSCKSQALLLLLPIFLLLLQLRTEPSQ
jgi:hypothetical protein